MTLSAAIINTAMWDVVGWNRAAALLLTDYAQLPREGQSILRMMFGSDRIRATEATSASRPCSPPVAGASMPIRTS